MRYTFGKALLLLVSKMDKIELNVGKKNIIRTNIKETNYLLNINKQYKNL